MRGRAPSPSPSDISGLLESHLSSLGLYESLHGHRVRCHICVRHCVLSSGDRSLCGARWNVQGRMHVLPAYPVSRMVVSQIERLRIPSGSLTSRSALVVGAYGCNFSCLHCINAKWSQMMPPVSGKFLDTDTLARSALAHDCAALVFSITEPLVLLDHVFFSFKKAKSSGLATILCSNGSFTESALELICEVTDYFRIDLKGFSNRDYRTFTGVSAFREVHNTIRVLHDKGKEVALQFVPVPGVNDHPRSIKAGIRGMDGLQGLPITIVRFIPAARLQGRPPADDKYLRSVAQCFLEAGFDTTIREV